jgi:hypothetical protein
MDMMSVFWEKSGKKEMGRGGGEGARKRVTVDFKFLTG